MNGADRPRVYRLGTFVLTGTRLRVTDPCYTRDTWCKGVVNRALPGVWRASVKHVNTGDFGIRVSELVVQHETFTNVPPSAWHQMPFDIGVDSGQAGIFDEERYPTGDTGDYGDLNTFYGRACERTGGSQVVEQAGVVAEGAVSSSGFGDGSYTCWTHLNADDQVDAVKIVFITEDEAREHREYRPIKTEEPPQAR